MSDMQFTETEYENEETWRAEGRRRFGDNVMKWRFVCPVCKTVVTPQDYKDAGAPQNVVAFSCLGRFNGQVKGCDYAGGGLLRLNPVHVGGHENNLFAYAPDPATQTATQRSESGFTLIEVFMALVVVAILAGFLLRVFYAIISELQPFTCIHGG